MLLLLFVSLMLNGKVASLEELVEDSKVVAAAVFLADGPV
jgi:hypothetical protein